MAPLKRLHIWLSTLHCNWVARAWKRWQRKQDGIGRLSLKEFRACDTGILISGKGIWCRECQRWFDDNEKRCRHIAKFEAALFRQGEPSKVTPNDKGDTSNDANTQLDQYVKEYYEGIRGLGFAKGDPLSGRPALLPSEPADVNSPAWKDWAENRLRRVLENEPKHLERFNG